MEKSGFGPFAKIFGVIGFILLVAIGIKFDIDIMDFGFFGSIFAGFVILFVVLGFAVLGALIDEKISKSAAEKAETIIKVVYTAILVGIFLGVIFLFSECGSGSSTSNTSKSIECNVCGRTYSYGTSDSRSISRTNMCTNCYDNYNWAQDMLN